MSRRAAIGAIVAVSFGIAAAALVLRPEPATRPAAPASPGPSGMQIPIPPPEEGATPRPAPVPQPSAVTERVARGLGAAAPASREEAVARALDPDAGLAARIVAAEWLAELDDDEAFGALERILASPEAPAALRGAVAEALGGSPHRAAAARLRALADDDDPLVVEGALHGLGAAGSAEATQALSSILADPEAAPFARQAAAEALGEMDAAAAQAALRQALAATGDATLAASVLSSLARSDLAASEPVFRELLADPSAPLDLRTDAVEALEEAGTAAHPLLLETAARAPDPALRSAAVHALAGAESPSVVGRLAALLAEEADPLVRADLYGALAFDPARAHQGLDAESLVGPVLAEPSDRARVEGARLLARLLPRNGTSPAAAAFDRELAPWLEGEARDGEDAYRRLTAVDALALRGSPASVDALHRLRRADDPAVAAAADRVLARRGSARP